MPMKRLSAIWCACAFLIGMCVPAHAGNPGSSCQDAIPMGKDYTATIKSGTSVWYSAWTFDLPLTVTFAPKNGKDDPAPHVEMDFTCTPGFYEDSILCSLFCKTSGGSGIQLDMPHSPKLDSKTLDNGTFVYYLSLGKNYRDYLLKMGISENLEVYVKVTYNSAGIISMAPDDLFSSCVDNAKFMHLGDTVKVKPNDKKRHVIVPYVQWQEDTIVYKWDGTKPCQLAVGNTCDFDPTDNTNPEIINYEVIEPGGSFKITANQLYHYVHDEEYPNEAGMYFAKFYSEEQGVITIEKVPQSPPRGKATLLRYDRTYPLNANETALFAIPDSWNDEKKPVLFSTPTRHKFTMYIANDPDFADEHILQTCPFDKSLNGHGFGISGAEMTALWKRTNEHYLYIRFECTEATTITPSLWEQAPCVANTKNVIHSLDTAFLVSRNSTGGNYLLDYPRYVGGDMTLTFTKKGASTSAACEVFIATDCNISLSSTAPNLLFYHKLTASKKSVTIPAETIASWAEKVAEDGNIYARFNHTQSMYQWQMRLKSDAAPDADPVYPASTIAVSCEESHVVVSVSETQTIVIMNEKGESVDSWEADPANPYILNLPAGKYTLQGNNEKIILNL